MTTGNRNKSSGFRVTWDKDAGAVYVYMLPQDQWPSMPHQEDVHGDGSLILDLDRTESVLGIEMLSEPTGVDGSQMMAQHWVLAARAWERAQNMMTRPYRSLAFVGGEFQVHG